MGARYSIIPSLSLLDTRLSPRDITVLCVIGSHTDKQGYCIPSLNRVGQMLGVSRQAVQKSVKKLVECGYMEKIDRFRDNGSQTSNSYHVDMNHTPPEAAQRKGFSDFSGNESDNHRLHPPQQQVAPPATSEVAPITTPYERPLFFVLGEAEKNCFDWAMQQAFWSDRIKGNEEKFKEFYLKGHVKAQFEKAQLEAKQAGLIGNNGSKNYATHQQAYKHLSAVEQVRAANGLQIDEWEDTRTG